MTMKFREYEESISTVVDDLKDEIKGEQDTLEALQTRYTTLIGNGDDDEADETFLQMEKLKESIKKKSYRLSVKQRTKQDSLKQKAYETIDGIKVDHEKAQEKLDSLDRKMTELVKEAEKLQEKADEVVLSYARKKSEYERLLDRFNLESKVLKKQGLSVANGNINLNLNTFKDNKGAFTTRTEQ